MIRELRKADINIVADIWLDTNIKAHCFIPAQYWKRNLELVKELLLQATVYVYEDNYEIPVSYTHLDVYKRQELEEVATIRNF